MTNDTKQLHIGFYNVQRVAALILILAVLTGTDGCQNRDSPPFLAVTAPMVYGYIQSSEGEGISGVAVSANNGGSTAVTNAAGWYEIRVPQYWSGVIQPQHAHYHFDPPHRVYDKLARAVADEDYSAQRIERSMASRPARRADIPEDQPPGSSATHPPVSMDTPQRAPMAEQRVQAAPGLLATGSTRQRLISGHIRDPRGTAEAGIVVSASKGGGTAISDQAGHYMIRVPSDWSGAVIPQRKEYVFDPPQHTFPSFASDLVNVDFTATHGPVTISGTIRTTAGNGIAGVTMFAEGRGRYVNDYAKGTTGNDGTYKLEVPFHWSGSVTPVKTPYSFTPDPRVYESVVSNHAGQDYTAVVIGEPPVATSGNAVTDEDTPVVIPLVGHDPDGQSLVFSIITNAAHGTLDMPRPKVGSPVMEATVSYTPFADYYGEDAFTYVVDDGSQISEPVSVAITIRPAPDSPKAHASSMVSTPGQPIEITLSASDPDGDVLTYTIVTQPEYGVLTGIPPNLTYTLKAEFDAEADADQVVYVDPQITEGSCRNYDPDNRACGGGTATAYRSLRAAAEAAVAGWTVVVREGTYQEQLVPRNSGTPGNYITFRSRQVHDGFSFQTSDGQFESETVTVSIQLSEDARITGAELNPAIDLSNRSYIVLDGLRIENVDRWLHAVNTHHNIVRHCQFNKAINRGGSSKTGLFFQDATFNKILHNTISDSTQDNLSLVHSDRNLVEGNTITKAAHTLWAIKCGNFNVVRDNYFHNERQKIGEIYDCHNVGFNHEYYIYDSTKYNLVERNIFAYAPSSGNHSPYAGIQYAGQNGIIRHNRFYDTVGPALDLTLYAHEATYNTDNRIFHNVFYATNFAGLSMSTSESYPFSGHVIKNNIFLRSNFVANDKRWKWYTKKLAGQPVQIMTAGLTGFVVDRNCLYNERPDERFLIAHGRRNRASNPEPRSLSWWQESHAHLFRDNLETDPVFMNEEKRDFQLREGSPMIDAGAYLTRTTGDGQGARLPVEDVGYFCDGFGIPGEKGDLIRLEGDHRVARIVRIDYSHNTLLLDQELSWRGGQGVALNYVGHAPDIGAFEYLPDGHWPPVASFTINPQPDKPLEIEFDAGSSYDPSGSALRYDWDFGDGTRITQNTPQIAHAYARPGIHTITLSVTSEQTPSRNAEAARTFRVGRPELIVEPTQLEFGPSLNEGILTIRNHGEGLLAYHLSSSETWLKLDRVSGTLMDIDSLVQL
ncbi:MAG: PKD domain-containing protein, partial [Phycisphaerales bacterium]|nr:PKD domain-containing protein [Phycisphaerales bacterium]